MNSDADCQTFLQTVVGGTAGDGLLWDCVKNVLKVPQVYCVEAPELETAAAVYAAQGPIVQLYAAALSRLQTGK